MSALAQTEQTASSSQGEASSPRLQHQLQQQTPNPSVTQPTKPNLALSITPPLPVALAVQQPTSPGGCDDDSPSPGSPRGAQNVWTSDDDNNLRKAVDEHGEDDWAKVAAIFNQKSGKSSTGVQCQKRWQKLASQKQNIKVRFKKKPSTEHQEGTMDPRGR